MMVIKKLIRYGAVLLAVVWLLQSVFLLLAVKRFDRRTAAGNQIAKGAYTDISSDQYWGSVLFVNGFFYAVTASSYRIFVVNGPGEENTRTSVWAFGLSGWKHVRELPEHGVLSGESHE